MEYNFFDIYWSCIIKKDHSYPVCYETKLNTAIFIVAKHNNSKSVTVKAFTETDDYTVQNYVEMFGCQIS